MTIVRNNQGRGKTGRGFGLSGPRGLIPVAALGVACSSLLGIEDVNPGSGAAAGTTSAGSGGASATGGNGGKGGATGGSAGKGAGGASGAATGGDAGNGSGGKGGASGGKGGTGGSGGDSGQGGEGNETSTGGTSGKGGGAGSAGSAGSGGTPGDPTVRGKVVNHLLHPVPNVPVWIGDEMTSTDDDGEFELADVAETYDVKMVVTYARYGNTAVAGWVYEGLTRRDPTLQVYGGTPLRSGNFTFSATNPPASMTATAIIALGSPYGNYSRQGTGAVQTSFSWFGASTITATPHGLVWEETSGVPTSYTSYTVGSAPVAFADTATTPWTLDFTPNTVNTDTVSGAVVAPTTDDRSNAAFVQFATGAVIELASQTGSSALANYSFLVPTLPNATITVVAREGDASFGALALAHRSNLTSGQTTPALTIPAPPTLVGPADGSTLNESSMFTWLGPQSTSVWHAESVSFYESIYVVTARKSIPMPTFPNGFSLRAADDAFFRVEAHGDAATVDELAGSNGFVDSFGPWGDVPDGPRRDAGTFAISGSSLFWTP
jgi:hypothetical protein